jgi:hypothetical protein
VLGATKAQSAPSQCKSHDFLDLFILKQDVANKFNEPHFSICGVTIHEIQFAFFADKVSHQSKSEISHLSGAISIFSIGQLCKCTSTM